MAWITILNPDFIYLFDVLGGMHRCFAEAQLPWVSRDKRETLPARAQWQELGREFNLILNLIFNTSNKLQ